MLLYARAGTNCVGNLLYVGAILQEREDALARVDDVRAWLIAHAPAADTEFDTLLIQATDEVGCDLTTTLAALWDLISSHKFELLPGSRVRSSVAPQ